MKNGGYGINKENKNNFFLLFISLKYDCLKNSNICLFIAYVKVKCNTKLVQWIGRMYWGILFAVLRLQQKCHNVI